jgi:IS605 OrfB family transposase
MLQVQRHFHPGSPLLLALCRESKNLYNRCNFLMRRSWFDNVAAKKADPEAKWIQQPDLPVLVNALKDLDCFRNLHNSKTAKQTIRKCITDWSNFRAAIVAFKKNPEGFLSRPKPPYYKKSVAQVIFYNETLKGGQMNRKLDHLTATNDCFSLPWDGRDYRQVVVTPKHFGLMIEVQYDSKDKPKQKRKEKKQSRKRMSKDRQCNIDIGLNNLCAITLVQQRPTGSSLLTNPILVNGRILKSVNQWYNKQLAKQMSNGAKGPSKRILKKRYFRIENYFHHVSKLIVGLCLKHGIPKVVIGKNDGWKQRINLGRKTNQKFCSMPFYLLLEKIKYKAGLEGIEVLFTEEAYTSKASYFDNDPIPKWDKDVKPPEFSGKRKYRGLYVTSDGFAINADVNGSLNIGRKVIGEGCASSLTDRSLAARPAIVNPLKVQR